mmetsp:Transcript_82881/g.231146  ORF Transcript_82881/g.231146 Transcript_82881/m.231146 type:complete len:97 (-) Transcript_82881:14-304(-)
MPIAVRTAITWADELHGPREIRAQSKIRVRVDPPDIFRRVFPRRFLETVGRATLRVALRVVLNGFVQALARDYERWAVDEAYRAERLRSGSGPPPT